MVGLVSDTVGCRSPNHRISSLSVCYCFCHCLCCLSLLVSQYCLSLLCFIPRLYGNISLVATSIRTARDQSAEEPFVLIPQKGLRWTLVGLPCEEDKFFRLVSLSDMSNIYDRGYRAFWWMDSTESHGEPGDIYQRKPCCTASLPAALKVIPPEKGLCSICNIDGEVQQWDDC